MEIAGDRRLTRLRTLGRGSSGAVVALFAAVEGEGEGFVAVKSAGAGAAAAQLRREGEVLARLRSPHVIPFLGAGEAGGGGYRLFLEFAPRGSLVDEVGRNGGRLEEGAVRAYAADVARGLAYLHAESVVHGDVKGRNVVVGADGRAKLADFGCARRAGSASGRQGPIIGGTPAFMAPEVARGEEQGPAADVWALGCTVLEMATGRAPWTDMDGGDGLAAVHRIGFTDAVPEPPEWMSPEAKDFLEKCFRRRACERWTAVQLLEHPFLALAAAGGARAGETKDKWVSPKSTLDAAIWESDTDDEDDDIDAPESTAARIRALAGPCSALPDWDSDDGSWIELCSNQPPSSSAAAAAAATPAEQTHCDALDSPAADSTRDVVFRDEALRAPDAIPSGIDTDGNVDELARIARITDAVVDHHQLDISLDFIFDPIVLGSDFPCEEETVKSFSNPQIASAHLPPLLVLPTARLHQLDRNSQSLKTNEHKTSSSNTREHACLTLMLHQIIIPGGKFRQLSSVSATD